jgi:hypothetical protein
VLKLARAIHLRKSSQLGICKKSLSIRRKQYKKERENSTKAGTME